MRAVAIAILSVASSVAAQPITANEALSRALDASPTLRASEADLRSARGASLAADGARTPALVVGTQGTFQESFAGTSMGITRNSSQSLGGNVAFRYTTELGTVLELGLTSSAAWRTVNLTPGTTTTITVGPNFLAQATLDARQPLLRGLGQDAVLGSIRQSRETERAAEHTRDRTSSQLALDVLGAWWELWYAQSTVTVQQESLRTAEQQLEAARLRASALGTASRADVLQFASQHASIRESLALALSNRVARAITLGRLLAIPPERALDLVAVGDPPEAAPLPSVSELVQSARAGSSELGALEAQRDAARERMRATGNAAQPRLDLTASLAMGGLWNDATIGSLQLPDGRPAFAAIAGLELELPLGTSQADGQHVQASADLEAAQARYEDRVSQIEAEVVSLRAELEARREQIALAGESADIARQLAEAERGRLALGTTTPLAVVQAQQTQREAELRRLRAIVDRLVSLFSLEHRTGLLLERARSLEPSS